MIDYHIHSRLSYDGESSFEQIVTAAANAGLQEICITDHMDIVPDGMVDRVPQIDMVAYDAAFAALQERDLPLPVKKGVELGVHREKIKDYQEFTAQNSFDFIICSQHFAENTDFYFPAIYERRASLQEAYDFYLGEILYSITHFKEYSVVGHIGYAARSCDNHLREPFCYARSSELFDAILKTVIADGKGIEVNTSSLCTVGIPMPPSDVLARYRELGGEIVTIGSDAHHASRVGDGCADIMDMLKSIGFSYVTTFEAMQPIFHKI